MTYEDIAKANAGIKPIDLKGKDYAMVPDRVTAFRKLYPNGFINTEIISNDGTTILMQARVGYYENGCPITLGTGYAQETKGKGMVNATSHVENCETSAVGRALGFLGLGINGGGICSAEELVNAITAQKQIQEEQKPKAPATVTVTDAAAAAREKSVKTLRQNAAFAYGTNAEAKLNELLNAHGVTMETMTGQIFKAINAQIMVDVASGKKVSK